MTEFLLCCSGIYFAWKAPTHIALSNFAWCKIRKYGVEFSSSEQEYQYWKAQLACQYWKSEEILKASGGVKAKILGSEVEKLAKKPEGEVPGFKGKWESVKVGVMEAVLYDKFTQLPQYTSILKQTGNCRLVEATRDGFWGFGVPIWDVGKGFPEEGKNELGKLLMELRQNFIRAGPGSRLPKFLVGSGEPKAGQEQGFALVVGDSLI